MLLQGPHRLGKQAYIYHLQLLVSQFLISSASQVEEAVRGILGGGAHQLPFDADAPLMSSAGLDSLGAVELRSVLEASLGGRLQLPPTRVFDYPSMAAITDYLVAKVGEGGCGQEAWTMWVL